MSVITRGHCALAAAGALLLAACAATGEEPASASAGVASVSPQEVMSAPAAPAYAAQWASYTPVQKAKGREIYMAVCVSCHGRSLEGATGYRLSDTQWVHGGSFDEVTASILKGFPEKGMPGLEGAYPQEDINALTAYILSQQGGWLDHQYEIWAVPDGVEPFDPAWLQETPIDAGVMNQPIPTFVKPEIPEYAMRISGNVLIPEGEPTYIFSMGWRIPMMVEIDGEPVQPSSRSGGLHFPIPAGQHHLSLTYTTVGSAPRRKGRPLNIFLTNEGAKVRKFALTMGAQRTLENTTIKFLAEEGPVTMRRRIVDIPAHSIAVGFPDQYNYAFNPRSCSLVGAWRGEFLDIGPNAVDRGTFGAVPLGEWHFKQPQAISLGGDHDASCDYQKMTKDAAGVPVFHFTRDGVAYNLTGSVGLYGLELELARDDAQGTPVTVVMPEGLGSVSLDAGANDRAKITIE